MPRSRTLDQKLRGIARRVDAVSLAAVDQAAEELAAEIRNRVPVDTGDLRADVRIVAATADKSGVKVSIVVGETAKHAAHVEYGTQHMLARPYIRPAIDIDGPRITAGIERRIVRSIDR